MSAQAMIGPTTVKLPLRWEDGQDGDSVFWAGPFEAGCVGHTGNGWYVASYFGSANLEDYATQAEAMAALQAAVLEAIAP